MNPQTLAAPSAFGPQTLSAAPDSTSRIDSVDLIRGVVMILMAVDHVRVYAGVPAGGPDPAVFLTRWITHFCAPAFVFLAGTGAYLHGRKLADPAALARFLLTRGVMLVVLELTVIRFFWTFDLAVGEFLLAGVIWMLGWCMILMAALVRLPVRWLGFGGIAVILFQELFGLIPRALPGTPPAAFGWVWEFLYPAGMDGVPGVWILYHIVPWIGVMAAGFAFGAILTLDAAERRRLCLRIGLTATALFVVVGGAMVALQGGSDEGPAIFRLLNQRKYPASQLFLLMTLGPTIALLPLAEGARGWMARAATTFGRVPLFYYLLHIPVIHLAALGVNYLRDGQFHAEWYAQAPATWVPDDQRWSLALLYAVFAGVIIALYFPCRWYARVKSRSRHPALKLL